MKPFSATVALLFTALSVTGGSQAEGERPVLEGPYMGQEPPGLTPVVFAPGVISTKGWEISGVFSPDMNEFYFIGGEA